MKNNDINYKLCLLINKINKLIYLETLSRLEYLLNKKNYISLITLNLYEKNISLLEDFKNKLNFNNRNINRNNLITIKFVNKQIDFIDYLHKKLLI